MVPEESTAGQSLVGKDSPGTQQNFLLGLFIHIGKLSLGQARVLSSDPDLPFLKTRTSETSQALAELGVCPLSICVFAWRVSSACLVVRLMLTPRG